MASETKNLVRATVNTRGSVTTVRIETDVTAKMFLGCPIVQLTDEKGVSYSRNSLFVNMFGDIISITGNYVGNLRDSNIKIIVK